MQFDVTLNVAWLSLSLLALCIAARLAFRRDRPSRAPRWLLLVGVGLVVTSLFPYISASDDVVRMDGSALQQASTGHQQTTTPSGERRNQNLIRLYETMDAPLVCRIACVALTFYFVALICTHTVQSIERTAPQLAGRSPPFAIYV